MRPLHFPIAIAAILFAAPAYTVIIDQFDGEMPPDRDTSLIGPGILGGERDLLYFTSTDDDIVEIDASGGSSFHLYGSVDQLEMLVAGVSWNGIDVDGEPPGLGGVDLTEGGTHKALAIRVLSLSTVTPLLFGATLTSSSGTAHGTLEIADTIASPQTLYIPFSSMNVSDDFSFSSVDTCVLFLFVLRAEVQIDWIGTAQVPEPSSIVLAVLAFVGLAAFRWRRKRELLETLLR